MKNLHWRYNYNGKCFDWVDTDKNQHYYPLLHQYTIPTLVIDINLVSSDNLYIYLSNVLDKAKTDKISGDIIFDQLIFDATQDPVYDYIEKVAILNNFIKEKGIPGTLSLSQYEINQHTYLKEILYPSWLFIFRKQQVFKFDKQLKKYRYSCLNRNPTWHRLLFYTLVKEANLLDQFVYTFYDRCPYTGNKISKHTYSTYNKLFGNFFNDSIENIKDFPLAWPDDKQGVNDHSILHPAYRDTECNIVTETSATVSFTSEKIWKPIAAGQVFHVIGCAKTNSWLRELGYQTFDTGSDYDSIVDNVERFRAVVDILINEEPANKQNLFKKEHNYHWFHSGNADYKLIHEALEILQIGK